MNSSKWEYISKGEIHSFILIQIATKTLKFHAKRLLAKQYDIM